MDADAIVETTTDIVEAAVEHAEAVEVIIRNNPIVVASAFLAGITAGAYVSHILTKKHMALRYEAILENEIEKAHEYYKSRNAETFVENVSVIVQNEEPEAKKAEGIMGKAGYVAYHNVSKSAEDVPTEKVVEVITFDYEEEERKRSSGLPYIIDMETYMTNEDDNDQLTLVYYDEDEVLSDDADEIVHTKNELIGTGNLRFGYGSEDPKIVYIRNEQIATDYEVVLFENSYTKEVLGLHDEEDKPPIRKFRNGE